MLYIRTSEYKTAVEFRTNAKGICFLMASGYRTSIPAIEELGGYHQLVVNNLLLTIL